MKIVPPSTVRNKDLRRLEPLRTLPKKVKVLSNAGVVWIPYYEITASTETNQTSKTAFNAFLPMEEVRSEDLLLFFRPNFLDKQHEERDQLPRVKAPRVNTMLPKRTFPFREVEKRITRLSSRVQLELDEKRGEYHKRLSKDVSPRRLFLPSERLTPGRAKEYEAERKSLTHLNAVSIVLKESLRLPDLFNEVQFETKDLFYYPYLLMKPKGRYILIDMRKRGWWLFKRLIVDEGLSRMVNEYPSLQTALEQEVQGIPNLASPRTEDGSPK